MSNVRHLITLEDFADGEIIETVESSIRLAGWLAGGGAQPNEMPFSTVLKGSMIHLAFFEPSTRTRMSFETAAKLLGADVISMTSAGSSVEKGESLSDTAYTLGAMSPHLVVVRHPQVGSAAEFSKCLDVPVVNAGDGAGHHPTQALLDITAIHARRPVVGEGGKQINLLIVGDIKRSRVARSNVALFTRFLHGVTLAGPPEMLPSSVPNELVALTHDLDGVIAEADAVMMLRIQKERTGSGQEVDIGAYRANYGLTGERLKALNENALILHPGPVNRGIEIDDAVYADPRCLIREQVRFGVAVRMCILARLLERWEALLDSMNFLGE